MFILVELPVRKKVACLLLESGADVIALDNVGRHAAHYAAQSRHVRRLLLLFALGANFDQVIESKTDLYVELLNKYLLISYNALFLCYISRKIQFKL